MRPSPLALLLTLASCAGPPPVAPAPSGPPSSIPSAAPPATAVPTAVPTSAPSASAAPVASAPAPSQPAEEPLPEGFVRVAEEGQTRCGDLLVELPPEPDGEKGQHFVSVHRRDGKRVYEAHGQRYKLDPSEPAPGKWRQWMSVEFCGDLTGDGIPELVLTESTIGAHCCYTHHVVSLTSPAKRLMTWEKGDMGTPLVPVKYRAGPSWQIAGLVVVWPPFDPDAGDPALAGYAGAPVVPVVFSLRAGEYQLTSLSFPEAFRRSRASIHAGCKNGDSEDCDGVLIAWIDSLAVGDWETEKKKPMYKEMRPALERRAAAMMHGMVGALGSERSPAKLTPLR